MEELKSWMWYLIAFLVLWVGMQVVNPCGHKAFHLTCSPLLSKYQGK